MVYQASHVETISVLNVKDAIHVGYNLTDYIVSTVLSTLGKTHYCIVTDTNLASIYLNKFIQAFERKMQPDQRLLVRVLASGEGSKSREIKASIEDYMFSEACTRDTCMLALGGGVIGDLVGYTASTFMRGIPFVQIPTTLLAMVDSSIGGKTAIDVPAGKNLIGSFWQPRFIFMDLAMLQTLPRRELANGMAEVIKTAAISSKDEFERLESGKRMIESVILERDTTDQHMSFVASVISASAKYKAHVVTIDERESGLRGLLNFGHSIGHALEAELTPDWLHGECVSVGLILEAELACSQGHGSPETTQRLADCLALYDLPTKLDDKALAKLTVDKVMTNLKLDKKNKGAQKRIVLLSEIGRPLEQKASNVPDHAVLSVLSSHLNSKNTSASGRKQTNSLPNITLIFQKDLVLPSDLLQLLQKDYKIQQGQESWQCTARQSSVKNISIHLTRQAGSSVSQSGEYEYVIANKNNLLDFIETVSRRRYVRGKSSFVTPTIEDYELVPDAMVSQWLEGADAIEFRVDYVMKDNQWVEQAGRQLALVREKTELPVIFTIRSIPQAGRFDPTLTEVYVDLVCWAHRWGCEYVDVELETIPSDRLNQLVEFNKEFDTKLIMSFHDPAHQITWPEMSLMYDKATAIFKNHNHSGVIKLVGYALDELDNIQLEHFRHQIDPHFDKELIMINMGSKGKISRVTNRFMSPATHPSLPTIAAPGQLSIKDMNTIRALLDMD